MPWTAAAPGQAPVRVDVDLRKHPPAAAASASFSRIGLSCLHGPHQYAQKSMITGVVNDRSATSV